VGSTSAIDVDRDGRSIWVGERCGANTCLDRATGQMSALPSILKFDSTGKLVASFGQGMLIFPHGLHIDRDGNLWVTDGQDDAPQTAPPARGAQLRPDSRPPLPRGMVRCQVRRAGIRSSSSARKASCC
jgi:sugar lactone lactonase YvrE